VHNTAPRAKAAPQDGHPDELVGIGGATGGAATVIRAKLGGGGGGGAAAGGVPGTVNPPLHAGQLICRPA